MNHGKKKFIEAYDGRIKRSNDRTKKDYYRELRWWDDRVYLRWNRRYNYTKYKSPFCPQCKHVQKPIIAEEEAWAARDAVLRAEYDKKYGEADRIWKEYSKSWWRRTDEEYELRKPTIPQPPNFSAWVAKVDPAHHRTWNYHSRSYLCFKCEYKYEMKREMWTWHSGYPGYKRNYTYTRRQDWKSYKNEVKAVMQKAKYDEDYYDEIPKYKRGWLD